MSAKAIFNFARSPATVEELNNLRSACGILPASYLDFLAESNGAEWSIHDQGGDCLSIWPSGEVPQLNEDYQIARWVPELIVIGSDGGGDAIGFDRSASSDPASWTVVRIGFGNLDRDDFVRLASGFQDWQAHEFRLND